MCYLLYLSPEQGYQWQQKKTCNLQNINKKISKLSKKLITDIVQLNWHSMGHLNRSIRLKYVYKMCSSLMLQCRFAKEKLGWSKEKTDEILQPVIKSMAKTNVSVLCPSK